MEWIKIILALLLFWPRGYVLIYLIDRSKSMSFGLKFFAGWLLGLAGFTADMFGAVVFSGLEFSPLIIITSSITQIFGFSFMIFIFERRILYPKIQNFIPFIKKQISNFNTWLKWEKIGLIVFIAILLVRTTMSIWAVTNTPTYDFDAWNNWNLKAKSIHYANTIPTDKESPDFLGGGIRSYPLNDALLKVWVAKAVGEFEDKYVNLVSIFYYLLLIGFFYFLLPSKINRGLRLFATYALSSLPLLYFHSQVAYVDLLFSIFLLMTVGSMFYFLAGRGNSFYYLSGMGLAFAIWTKNEGFSILLPVMIATTLILLIAKKVNLKDFLLQWFFAALTVGLWLIFRIWHRLDILSGDSSALELVFNSQFFGDVFSSIFLRSHFNILWLVVAAVIILRFKDNWKNLSLRYLMLTLLVLFVSYNGIILFTDKALNLSALARINMQLAPLAVLFLVSFFDKINTRAPLENNEASKHTLNSSF